MNRFLFSSLIGLGILGGTAFAGHEALKTRYETVESQTVQPSEFSQQTFPIVVNGEPTSEITYEEAGYSLGEPYKSGDLFDKHLVYPVLSDQEALGFREKVEAIVAELEVAGQNPYIDENWNVVEGTETVQAFWDFEESRGYRVETVVIPPNPSTLLQTFVDFRNENKDGFRVDLKRDGETVRWFDAEEIAPYLIFDREALTMTLDEILRGEFDNKLNSFKTTGTLGRYQFAGEGNREPNIVNGQLQIVGTYTEPKDGTMADKDASWELFKQAVLELQPQIEPIIISDDPAKQDFDLSLMTVKLAESRTPNTGGSRMTNIKRLLELVDGTVVMPGETFGLNSTVGNRTRDKGFVEAGAIQSGKHVQNVGGGISQTATMFYQAAYMSGLLFPEREGTGIGGGHEMWGHSEYLGRYNNYYAEGWGMNGVMETGRLGYGVEQTVNWSNREAGFVNNTPYPILVKTYYGDGDVGVALYSIERTQYGVYEGTSKGRYRTCNTFTHSRTVYNMNNEPMFSDSFSGSYRTQEGTC